VVLGDQPELHLLFQFTTGLDFQSEVVTFLFLFTPLHEFGMTLLLCLHSSLIFPKKVAKGR
jgi:hypothetical protein